MVIGLAEIIGAELIFEAAVPDVAEKLQFLRELLDIVAVNRLEDLERGVVGIADRKGLGFAIGGDRLHGHPVGKLILDRQPDAVHFQFGFAGGIGGDLVGPEAEILVVRAAAVGVFGNRRGRRGEREARAPCDRRCEPDECSARVDAAEHRRRTVDIVLGIIPDQRHLELVGRLPQQARPARESIDVAEIAPA